MALSTIPLGLPIDPRLAAQQEEELRRRQSVADANERATMQMLETMQRQNDPRAIQQQQNFQRGMNEITARDRLRIDPDVVRAGGAAPGRLYGGQVQAPPGNPNPFLRGLSQLGRRTMDALADPVANAQIVSALNTLRFKPDPNLAKSAQARAETVQASRQQAQKGNMTAQYLRQIGKPELADLVDADPSLATDALSMAYGLGDVSDKFFAPQTDPVTGEVYVVRVNPNTGQAERVAVPGAQQLTEQEKANIRTRETIESADFGKAQKVGVDAMQTVDRIDTDLGAYQDILDALDDGANTGPLISLLPTTTAATALLESAANKLGLGVVSSVTFGALSKGELDLALRTPINAQLPPDELREQVASVMAAKKKLRDDMYEKAYRLASGEEKYSDYIKSLRVSPEGLSKEAREVVSTQQPTQAGTQKPSPPPGFTQQMWDQYWSAMTEEQRRQF